MEKRVFTYDWQRQFLVTDHVKHKNGFTLYKITSVVFPKKNPEAGTKIIVWKRYNEFKQLHKELKRRHASLHLGGDFPAFVKPHFFDRFSDDVIRGRKTCVSDLLNFVAKNPALFTADIFVKFFREGYNISEYDDRKSGESNVQINEHDSDIDSFVSSAFPNMGQVLNTEGSQSSDESQCENSTFKRSKMKSNNAAAYNRLKKNLNCDKPNFAYPSTSSEDNTRFSFVSKIKNKGVPDYWEEAVAHADEAHQQEILGNYEVAFAMYKTAIVCLLSGVQGDSDVQHRTRVKELTSQYLLQAEWIYNNHLVFQNKPSTPKFSRIPWRSRSQLKRYKVVSVISNNLLVHDVTDNIFVVIKGVLKSGCPLDRSEICVLPKDVPYMVRLLALCETETTIFFVLEHVRYGKLWDHLEHYFANGYVIDNLDTEITCASPQEKDADASDRVSIASSGSSTNDPSLSRLESSLYTDTMSCESLSSHDENYFDLIEDYARAKSQKLKEIQDFNERRKHVESLRPVKKTVSQVDLKLMDDDNYEHHRSQSLTDLAHEDDCFHDQSQICGNADDGCSIDDGYKFMSDEENEDNEFSTSVDMDTQQLLRNAQRLIESINETLSKTENIVDDNAADNESRKSSNVLSDEGICDTNDDELKTADGSKEDSNDEGSSKSERMRQDERTTDEIPQDFDIDLKVKDENFFTAISPISDSIPSITEEYSVTAVLQRKGITGELVKKWAAQIVVGIDTLHQNGVVCRDLNPNNILLTDNGSIKLTYFFRYPNVDPSLSFHAIERLYVAPEVMNMNSNITFAADWWSFGAILYELITLESLCKSHPAGISTHTVLNIPEKIEVESKSLLTELLRYDPNERLGSGISGADDIKSHPYFSETSWEDV